MACTRGTPLGITKNNRNGFAFSGSINPVVGDSVLRLCSDLCNIVTPRNSCLIPTFRQRSCLSRDSVDVYSCTES